MLKKSLLTIVFLSTVLLFAGCNASKPEYIVTTVIPTQAAEGVNDKTTGFVKINPNFDFSKAPQAAKDIKWFDNGLGAKIPAIEKGNILEVINTDNDFVVYVANVDEQMFQKYYDKLMQNGFKSQQETFNWENLSFANDDYVVNLRYGQEAPALATIRAKKVDPKAAAPVKEAAPENNQ